MKRNDGVSMITLIITIIVIIILAAIAFVGMDDATGSAQYAKFSSEFGDYATNFTGSAVTKVQESLGLAGKVANKAQIVYCAARGVNLSEFDEVLNGVVTPGGYTSEKFQNNIKDATGATYVLADDTTPCYEIKDDVMNEYKGKSFYGNSNGQETHWVTATGKVFTLPGYPRTVDGEERMYISTDLYYVPKNGDMILASELTPIEAKKIGDETSGATIGSQEYADAADHAGSSGEGSGSGETGGDPAVLAAIKVGDFVEYTPDTAVSSSIDWRVWAIEGNDVVIMPTSPVGSLKLGESGNLQKCYEDWKNCVTLINNECQKYGNSKAKSVRSLTLEDLEATNVSTLASQKDGFKIESIGYEINKRFTYKSGIFAAKYNSTTGKNEPLSALTEATDENPIELIADAYMLKNPGWKELESTEISKTKVMSNLENYGDLLGEDPSWLASSCVACILGIANFDVYAAASFDFEPVNLLHSSGYAYSYSFGVRPLVSLSSAVLERDSEYETTWHIKDLRVDG